MGTRDSTVESLAAHDRGDRAPATDPASVPRRALSVVIPALNESEQVANEVEAVRRVLAKTDWEHEIIVVDDGSSDDTAAQAEGAGAQVLRQRINRGYGAALKRGIAASRHSWILITDADGTYPPEVIAELLRRAPDNDMVVASRTGKKVKMPVSKRLAKWFLRGLANYLSGRQIPDLNSGMRLMRRDLVERYEQLLPPGFSFTTTITLAAECKGHNVEYVPTDYHGRVGQSKIRPHHAFDFLLLIVRTVVFFNPLRIFLPLGALIGCSGLAKLVYDIMRDNLSESAVFAFLTAFLIWAVGLLADQISRLR